MPRALAPELPPLKLEGDTVLANTTIANACAPPVPWPVCVGEEEKTCVPKAGEGFSTCMRKAGDVPCPEGWPVRALFFDDVKDKRSCTECTCSAPEGGYCLASVSLASDATCSVGPLHFVDSLDPSSCFDVPSGMAIGSRAAEVLAYEPGTCVPSGGELAGELLTAGPMTICCLSDG